MARNTTPKQERIIEDHMRKIKEAKDNDNMEEVKRLTKRLYRYLEAEGLVTP